MQSCPRMEDKFTLKRFLFAQGEFALREWLPRCALFAAAMGLLLCGPAFGLDRDRDINEFYHTSWTAKDGAPADIWDMAQTADGWIWLAAASGLFRFDGVRFERFEPIGEAFRSVSTISLMARPNGELWIGFAYGGLSVLKDGKLTNYTERDGCRQGTVLDFEVDGEGAVWALTNVALLRFDGNKCERIGAEWNYPEKSADTMRLDQQGTLWIATEDGVVRLRRGSKSFEATGIHLASARGAGDIKNVASFVTGTDGALWLADGTGLRPLPGANGSGHRDPQHSASVDIFDRDGALWSVRCQVVCRVAIPQRRGEGRIDPSLDGYQHLDSNQGFNDARAHTLFEDREGNIWAITRLGLERFRTANAVALRFPESHQVNLSLSASANGAIWAASSSIEVPALWKIAPRPARVSETMSPITASYRDAAGANWFGGAKGIWRLHDDRFDPLPDLPDGAHGQMIHQITTDSAGDLWVSVVRSRLFRFKDGVWTLNGGIAALPTERPNSQAVSPQGSLWFGYRDSRIARVDDGKVRMYSSADGLNLGTVTAIYSGEYTAAGGERGMALSHGDRWQPLLTNEADRLRGITGIVRTQDGDLWVNGQAGVLRIPSAELERALQNPQYPVRDELFDALDGLPGTGQPVRPLPSAIEGTDGRLWFAQTNGIAWMDPAHLHRNALPPPVQIRWLMAGDATYVPSANLDLPKGTRNLRVEYTALSYSVPERVRFRYRLEGVDDNWQEAGTRRTAYYSNLGPGNFHFRVIASNNDGVWNETGAAVDFSIPPAFLQTKWFLAMCAAAGAGVLWLLFMVRVRQVQRRMRARLEAQLAERERIAQELHDTLLQGLLSASLQLSVANDQIAPGATAKPLVERVFQLLRQMADEGRSAVHGLRTHHLEPDDLERSFSQIPQDLAADLKIQYRLIVEGTPQSLRAPIRDEVYRIGREALANAFRHSGASVVEMVLDYARDHFRMVVRDNGCGMDPQVLRSGREGHWGLSGMHERAKKIGSRLNVRSADSAGTEIDLTVPASTAFEPAGSGGFMDWLARLYSRGEKS